MAKKNRKKPKPVDLLKFEEKTRSIVKKQSDKYLGKPHGVTMTEKGEFGFWRTKDGVLVAPKIDGTFRISKGVVYYPEFIRMLHKLI